MSTVKEQSIELL